jgi:DNA invertase Pin-like site-specific DNA recombinase
VRVALYARVSKAKDQTNENQLLELHKWAANNGHEVVGEWVDEASSRDLRPQKEALRKRLLMGEAKAVAFASLDRWGRSMGELISDLDEFTARGVAVYSMREALSFDSAAGVLQARILAAFAAFERDRIRERTMQGLDRARAEGKKLGRPKGVKETRPRQYSPPENEGGFYTAPAASTKSGVSTLPGKPVKGGE